MKIEYETHCIDGGYNLVDKNPVEDYVSGWIVEDPMIPNETLSDYAKRAIEVALYDILSSVSVWLIPSEDGTISIEALLGDSYTFTAKVKGTLSNALSKTTEYMTDEGMSETEASQNIAKMLRRYADELEERHKQCLTKP